MPHNRHRFRRAFVQVGQGRKVRAEASVALAEADFLAGNGRNDVGRPVGIGAQDTISFTMEAPEGRPRALASNFCSRASAPAPPPLLLPGLVVMLPAGAL